MPKHLEHSVRGVPCRIVLSEPQADGQQEVPKKIQILRTGIFHDPKYPKPIPVTKDILLSLVKNFKNNVRKIDLAIDYKHDSDDIAAGWFKELELSEDGEGLFAEIDWTKQGAQKLSEKEFRYVSADFQFNYIDNETKENFGPTLLGAGLTNRPVIKGMQPAVELNENSNGNNNGGNMDPKDKEIADLKAKIAELEAKAPKEDAPEMSALKKQLADMTAKCAEYEMASKQAAEKAQLAEKKTKFDTMLSEGKCVEAQRESFMKDDFKAFTDLAQPLKLSEVGNGGDGKGAKGGKEGEEKTAEDELIAFAETKMKENKDLDFGAAFRVALAEKPELAKKYQGI